MAFPSPVRVTRRVLLRGAAAACVASFAGCASRSEAPAPAGPSQLRLVGETLLPHRLQFKDTTVGGLSAIDHDPATGTWVTLSDDKSELAPARFYTLRVELREPELHVELLDVVTLRQADGQ